MYELSVDITALISQIYGYNSYINSLLLIPFNLWNNLLTFSLISSNFFALSCHSSTCKQKIQWRISWRWIQCKMSMSMECQSWSNISNVAEHLWHSTLATK